MLCEVVVASGVTKRDTEGACVLAFMYCSGGVIHRAKHSVKWKDCTGIILGGNTCFLGGLEKKYVLRNHRETEARGHLTRRSLV